MISQKTAQDVRQVIDEWRKERNIAGESIVILLIRLSRVAGNRSFRDSILGLLKIVQERDGGQS